MELLESVNMCLSALGETRVSSTSIRHPTVDLALGTIKIKQRQLLERGWWFNTSEFTMYPNDEGRIEYPVDAIAIRSKCRMFRYTMRGKMLFDAANNTTLFSAPVVLQASYNVDFEDLPECAANVVTYRAMRAMYVGDMGNDSSVSDMKENEALNYFTMETLHLRNMRYNTRNRRGYVKYRNALIG